MTNDYLANNCKLSVNTVNGWDLQAYRKGIVAEAFVMFLVYFASQLYRSILTHRGTHQLRQPLTTKVSRHPWRCRGMKGAGAKCLP